MHLQDPALRIDTVPDGEPALLKENANVTRVSQAISANVSYLQRPKLCSSPIDITLF